MICKWPTSSERVVVGLLTCWLMAVFVLSSSDWWRGIAIFVPSLQHGPADQPERTDDVMQSVLKRSRWRNVKDERQFIGVS